MKNMVITNLVLLAFIVVMVVDISGFVDSVKSSLKWVLTKGKMKDSNYRLKPLDCSLCMTFWTCVIYLFIAGEFTLPYLTFSLLLACFSVIIKDTILLVRDIATIIIRWFYKFID